MKRKLAIIMVIILLLQLSPFNIGGSIVFATTTINGITFDDTTVNYDGKYHSVVINNIPSSYTVNYTYKDENTGVTTTSSVNPSFKTIGKHSVSVYLTDGSNKLYVECSVSINWVTSITLSDASPDGCDAVKLNWATVSDADGYDIFYSTDESFSKSTIKTVENASTNSTSVDKLLYHTTYYFKVTPYKMNNGEKVYGTDSNTKSASSSLITDSTTKAEISNLTSDSLLMKWTEVKGCTGYAIYQVFYNSDGSFSTQLINNPYVSGLETTINNCQIGHSYTLAVVPYVVLNGTAQMGFFSNFVTGTLTLNAPTISSVSASSSTEVALTWESVDGATGYEIWYSTSMIGSYTSAGTVDSKTLAKKISNLTPGTTYYFKVNAYASTSDNDIVSSGCSSTKCATPVSTPTPSSEAKAPVSNITQNSSNDPDDTDNEEDADADDEEADDLPNVGDTFSVGNFKYVVTKSDSENGTVSIVKPAKKTFTKMTIPAEVEYNDYDFKVTQINQNAFNKCKKLNGIIISKNIKSINRKAFYNCKNLKAITIKTTVLKQVAAKAIFGINSDATINVPNQKLSLYKKLFKSGTGYKKTMKIV